MDWRDERFVTIAGQVKSTGRYMLSKGERLSSVITQTAATRMWHICAAQSSRGKK